jgi:hypothetical protein
VSVLNAPFMAARTLFIAGALPSAADVTVSSDNPSFFAASYEPDCTSCCSTHACVACVIAAVCWFSVGFNPSMSDFTAAA